jgi:hypothetical protein
MKTLLKRSFFGQLFSFSRRGKRGGCWSFQIPDENEAAETISDFIFLVYPAMFQHLHQIGLHDFERLVPLLTDHFCTLMPLCDCVDIWLAAAAYPSFLEFTQFMLIACLFLAFPNVVSMQGMEEQDLHRVVQHAVKVLDHRYLEKVVFSLGSGGGQWGKKSSGVSRGGNLIK